MSDSRELTQEKIKRNANRFDNLADTNTEVDDVSVQVQESDHS